MNTRECAVCRKMFDGASREDKSTPGCCSHECSLFTRGKEWKGRVPGTEFGRCPRCDSISVGDNLHCTRCSEILSRREQLNGYFCLSCGDELKGRRRKYCSKECQRAHTRKGRKGKVLSDCPTCGSPVTQPGMGPVKVYCSRKCKGASPESKKRDRERYAAKAGERAAERALDLKKNPPRQCVNCGDLLKVRRDDFTYCNKRECQNAKSLADYHSGKWGECKVDGCGKKVIGRGLCAAHYSAYWRSVNPGAKAAARHARRAAMRGVRYEVIDSHELAVRDGWKCHLCGGDVPQGLNWWDDDTRRLYPTVDHVIPLSKGGAHTWDNVKLAHFYCNSSKADNEGVVFDMDLVFGD